MTTDSDFHSTFAPRLNNINLGKAVQLLAVSYVSICRQLVDAKSSTPVPINKLIVDLYDKAARTPDWGSESIKCVLALTRDIVESLVNNAHATYGPILPEPKYTEKKTLKLIYNALDFSYDYVKVSSILRSLAEQGIIYKHPKKGYSLSHSILKGFRVLAQADVKLFAPHLLAEICENIRETKLSIEAEGTSEDVAMMDEKLAEYRSSLPPVIACEVFKDEEFLSV